VNALRFRRIRTFAALLLLSQGVPMINCGDEFGRTQGGNNNSWCQDNETGWGDWSLAETNKGLLRFFRKCIALRKRHPAFRRTSFFKEPENQAYGREISWQALVQGVQDWSDECRNLAFHLHLSLSGKGSEFFIMINGDRKKTAVFNVPDPTGENKSWRLIINTAEQSPEDIVDYQKARYLSSLQGLTVPAMGLIVLEAKST
jgi:glycogen operon protein